MNASPEPHGPVEPSFEEYSHDDDGFNDTLPVRPRRPFLTKWTAGLMALALGGVGFYVGVRVEKSKIPSTSASSGSSALARAFSGAAGSSSSRSTLASRFGGAGGLAGALGGAGANATIGSVSSVSSKYFYVTGTSGNTVKVKTSGATTITKSESVKRSKVYPGDQVVIQGVKGSGGTVTATSITDSGARSTGSSAPSAGSGGTSASSAISSLFGGG